MPATRPYRFLLPVWLWIFLAIAAAAVGWVRLGVDTGDGGLTNVATMLIALASSLVTGAWFLFFSRFLRRTRFTALAAGLVALALAAALFRFEGFSGSMRPGFGLRLGGGPGAPPIPGDAPRPEGVDLTSTAADFPGFLGAERDLTVRGIELARDWTAHRPELRWRQPIGAGWSAFAIVNAVAVTMEQRGGSELVTAYDLSSGRLLWAHASPVRFAHPLGGVGPRSTPTIDEGRVYALGATGILLCLDGATGDVIWEKDLLREFGLTPEQEFALVQYGRSNSPLVVGDLLVVPGGGNPDRPPASLVAYDKRTGAKVWEGGDRQISFSSPRLATLGGVAQILIVNEDTASGHDPATGARLWQHPWPGVTAANASASQAVPVPPDRVLLSKGYGEGAALLRLVPRGDGTFAAEELWRDRRVLRTKLTNVAVIDGHVYGLSDGILECVDLETGARVWKGGRYGHGQILHVGTLLLVLTEEGELVLIDPSPDRPNDVLGRLQAIEGTTWNNLALYGPYLAVRNAREAAVYRLPLAG
jgi:outer membrane protein assembly factor BamB